MLLGRDQISYERNDVLALLGRVYVHESYGQHVDRLQHLVNAELLIEMSHSKYFGSSTKMSANLSAVCCMSMNWAYRIS